MSTHVIPNHPSHPHETTIILLHGRSSTADAFQKDIFSHKTSSGLTLQESLPTVRWIFPASGLTYCTDADDERNSWFDTYSLDDLEEKSELQVDGLRTRVKQIGDVVEKELELLGGKSERLVIGGFSQGGATNLFTFLNGVMTRNGRLGGILLLSTWLPFASKAREAMKEIHEDKQAARTEQNIENKQLEAIVSKLRRIVSLEDGLGSGRLVDMLQTPVFQGHGRDDQEVSFSYGQSLCALLDDAGFNVEWHEYSGMERLGHWIKEPEEFDHIVHFIKRNVGE